MLISEKGRCTLIFGEEKILENVFCYFMNVTSLSWSSEAGSPVQQHARDCVYTLIFGEKNISENVCCQFMNVTSTFRCDEAGSRVQRDARDCIGFRL